MRLTLAWSALSTMVSVSRWRLRLASLEVRMWRLNACPRLNLPVPVFLKRLAAPLCVLSFGIAVLSVYNKGKGADQCLPGRFTKPRTSWLRKTWVRTWLRHLRGFTGSRKRKSEDPRPEVPETVSAIALADFAALRGPAASEAWAASPRAAPLAEPGLNAACYLPGGDETPRYPCRQRQ